ncbi:WYL domain-containing protein [Pseudoclavibacter chungangensis]|uniref:WYL domain-containing protein n=1 Tax=Pseudoclavibacter chungangensis TaxID=587635 RepID=A0A7J5BZX3_9MICO|nr:WYL domain-containing protein [Pseudoclavibacter chungangensis]KAB1660178.1 WYL domain-containing protein [Pseudoclavibacter chungangensis]NYJ66708.1 proteasome accessory factor C [Pseudoclavibacter chungangensis]
MNGFLGRDRLTLLVSLVPYLRTRPEGVTVGDVAAHFGVSHDEVRDAVRLIAVSGSPGEAGTYQDLDLFDIDWDALEDDDVVRVTRFIALEEAPPISGLEAAALIAGLQYLRQVPGLTRQAVIEKLLDKLTARTGGSAIAVDDRAQRTGDLGLVRRAVRDGLRLAFTYRSPVSGERRRTVDPIRLDALDDDWYLRAWCLDRDDERNFRVDRMRDVELTETPAEHHESNAPGDAFFTPSADDPVVALEVAESAVPLVREFLDDRSRLPEPDARGRRRVEVRAAHWDGIVRLACGNAATVRVLEPAAARAAVAEWARLGLTVQSEPPATP